LLEVVALAINTLAICVLVTCVLATCVLTICELVISVLVICALAIKRSRLASGSAARRAPNRVLRPGTGKRAWRAHLDRQPARSRAPSR
jgi:hypothetical protein